MNILEARKAADRVRTACRAGDQGTIRAVASTARPDPFLVAYELFVGGLLAASQNPEEPSASLAAAIQLAECARSRPETLGLAPRVRKWKESSREEREHMLGLHHHAEQLRKWNEARKELGLPDLQPTPKVEEPDGVGLMAAIRVWLERAKAGIRLSRLDEAAKELLRIRDLSEKIQWHSQHGYALALLALLEYRRNPFTDTWPYLNRIHSLPGGIYYPSYLARLVYRTGVWRIAERQAERFLAAFREQDEAAMKDAAYPGKGMPIIGLEALLRGHARCRLRGDPDARIRLEAAQAYESRFQDVPEKNSLSIVRRWWRNRPDTEARAAVRLGEIEGEIAAGLGVKPWSELSERAQRALREAGTIASCVIGTRLRGEAALILATMGSFREAAVLFRTSAESWRDLGWIRGQIQELDLASCMYFVLNQHNNRFEMLGKIRELQASIGLADAESYRRMAEAQMKVHRYDRAIPLLVKGIRLAGRKAPKDRNTSAEILYNLSICFLGQGKFERALQAATRSEKIFNEIGETRRIPKILKTLGSCHQHLGRFDLALDHHRRAREMALAQGDRKEAALALMERGVVLMDREKYRHALSAFEEAGAELDTYGDPHFRAITRINQAVCHLYLDEPAEAIPLLKQCRNEFLAQGNRRTAATALAELGMAHYAMDEYDPAARCPDQGYQEKKATGNHRGARITLTHLASLYNKTGYHKKALALYRQIEDEIPKQEVTGRIYLHQNIGLTLKDLEEYSESFEYLERAYRDSRSHGLHVTTANLLNNLGNLHRDTGQYERARQCLERALELCEKHGLEILRGNSYLALAQIDMNQDQYTKALENSKKALEVFRKRKDRSGIATTVRLVAHVHSLQDKVDQALELFKKSRLLFSELGMRQKEALCQVDIGQIHGRRGEDDKALEAFSDAIREMEALGDYNNVYIPQIMTAEIYRRQGRHEECVDLVRRSLAIPHRRSRGLAEEQSKEIGVEVRGGVETGLLALAAEARQQKTVAPEIHNTAFELLESGRGRVLAERILNRDALLEDRLPPDLFQDYCFARTRVTNLTSKVAKLTATGGSEGEIQAARKALEAAYHRFVNLSTDVERKAQQVEILLRPRPPARAEFQKHLPANSVLLEYLFTFENALVLAVTHDRTVLTDLGPASKIREDVNEYLDLVGTEGSDNRGRLEKDLAARLHALLLKPLEAVLRGKSVLLIAPDENLAFLPFEALLHKSKAGPTRVIEDYEVAYLPSAKVFDLLRKRNPVARCGQRFIGLGDPVYEDKTAAKVIHTAAVRGLGSLERLPESGAEVRQISQFFPENRRVVLLREQATFANLKKALAGPERIACLHLACHGHVDTRRPKLTGLFLNGCKLLSLAHVYHLRIPSDLTVLSACRTNRGAIDRGEGVIGLVRGFFYAGCPRVVVSNWWVNDASTRVLMVSFYRNHLENGLSPGAALRAAKLEMLRGGGNHARPYHWAPFVLWGLRD